jgi:DNA-directed RNA polymerase subunit omega
MAKKTTAPVVEELETPAAAVAAETEETPPEEKVMHDIDSKYRMILLAAQRSKQLQKGATVRVTIDTRKHKHTHVALEEIKQKKVYFEFTEEV